MSELKKEMVICIVNAGFSGEVMEIAHKLNVPGGTIVHARGTANQEAEKLFKITINPEKDMVLMVLGKDISEKVMKALYEGIGIGTEANGIVFALPVTNQIGIK